MNPNQLAVKIIRIVLGVVLVIFGLNHFFQFMSMPQPPEPAMKFLGALGESGFMWPLIGLVQVISGVLLVLGRYVLLGLTLFAPLAIGILLYHLSLDLAGGLPGYIVFILELLLVIAYYEHFRPLLKSKIE
ncbi:MAG: DoxX family membrane protein [Bacteroidales bacterium]